MSTWEDFVLVETEMVETSPRGASPGPSEAPCSERLLATSPQTRACFLSTLTASICSQHAVDLAQLQQGLKHIQKDTRDFQQKVLGTLQKLEGALGYLMDLVSSLETRSRDVEQRLQGEEDRGAARSKALSFLLLREKELREKTLALEKMSSRRAVWFEGVAAAPCWTKE
ncbi:coiled-coil domain-containing protein 182 [Hemicordylus capensis]|uniref:coiled-coil domain-containing protein 182 n=1 Tax=Hemicordylus capensis TaxID=884348 RepID=UPI0023024E91|nr:coiled-coil domain-containing protein 182 [Hemicordylus capensis]